MMTLISRCTALGRVCLAFTLLALAGCTPSPERPLQLFQTTAGGASAGALSRDGQHAVIGAFYHGISLWRLSDAERLYDWSHRAHTDTFLTAAAVSANGRWALTADQNTLALWDVTSGEGLRFWQAPGEILSVALDSNGERALLGLTDNRAVLFDVRRGGILQTLVHKDRVGSVAISDDGRKAVTGSDDYNAVVWNLQTGEALARVRHNDWVRLVALSPDGSRVLSMSLYDRAVVWHSDSGAQLGEIPLRAQRLKHGLRFTSVRFSDDNRYLLTGRPDQRINLWQLTDAASTADAILEVATWELRKRHVFRPSGAAILDLAFADAHKIYALASNGQVAILQWAGPRAVILP